MEELAAELGGKLTPEAVLERAENTDSALHDMFTWDDDEAAREYRLLQARGLIRRVVVHIEDARPSAAPVRAYLNVERGTGEYVAVSVVQATAGAGDAVLQYLLADLRSVSARLERYSDLLGSAELRGQIARFLDRHEKRKRSG